MACELRFMGIHVHGHEAEIDAFFEAVEDAVSKVEEDAPLLWPSLNFVYEEDGSD